MIQNFYQAKIPTTTKTNKNITKQTNKQTNKQTKQIAKSKAINDQVKEVRLSIHIFLCAI